MRDPAVLCVDTVSKSDGIFVLLILFEDIRPLVKYILCYGTDSNVFVGVTSDRLQFLI